MTHAHIPDVPFRVRRILTALSLAGALLAAIGVLVLRPTGEAAVVNRVGLVGPAYDARVEDAQWARCAEEEVGDPERVTEPMCLTARLRLLAGPDRGDATILHLPDSPTTPDLRPGDKVVMAYQEDAEPEFRYAFVDRQRKPVLFWLAVLFAVSVVVLGRLRGLAALGGLAASIVVLLWFMVPAILDGRDPLLVAVTGAAVVAYLALYLAHGFRSMTTVALLGTLASLGLTALLANLFVGIGRLSGFVSEEAVVLKLFAGGIDASGLVLAGIVIGALGALDDVTVTQASAVWELKAVNPGIGRRELYRSGIRIGRDHVASTVNTLLLAYAGAAMPLLLFFVLSEQPLASVANEEIVATEIIRTLVGSIGLVSSVPITTRLAAFVASSGPVVEHESRT